MRPLSLLLFLTLLCAAQVGCATKLCDENSPFGGFTQWQIWVCDYSPRGNIVGQRPY